MDTQETHAVSDPSSYISNGSTTVSGAERSSEPLASTSKQVPSMDSYKLIDDTEGEGPTEDGDGVYYFESDHLALKGNKEYQNLLKTIVILEAQRAKALQDLETVIKCQKEALKDPLVFVQKLQNGEDVGIPPPQNIASIPTIHWENYTSSVDPTTFGKHKHMTRNKKPEAENTQKDLQTPVPVSDSDSNSNMSISGQPQASVVRGRLRDCNKPSTFNQLWSTEEQRRLEELLIQYPPEEVEARRWQKIAKALGNRTTQQVASRVQKYFIKLAKAGLPIPGRAPNLPQYRRGNFHKHQRHNRFLYQSSTFLQAYEPRVYMSDDEDMYSYGGDSSVDTDFMTNINDEMEMSEEEDVPSELLDSEEYQELQELKHLKRQRYKEEMSGPAQHIGYKCDSCEREPIIGVRWHCTDCTGMASVDLCENCVDSMYESGAHNSSHRLEPIYQARGTAHNDRDYSNTKFLPGDYNYLDPNYMPAT